MARKVFFSFHYERDAWRAGQVRNSDLLANDDEYGFIDSVAWEEIKRKGDDAVKNWIKGQLEYTSVTVVLIGAETSNRSWVDYEIRESWNRGNGLLGIRIHNMKDQRGLTDNRGASPFEGINLKNGTSLSSQVKIYDWVTDNGRDNLGRWVEEAAKARGK